MYKDKAAQEFGVIRVFVVLQSYKVLLRNM